jgi:hypothetical protein
MGEASRSQIKEGFCVHFAKFHFLHGLKFLPSSLRYMKGREMNLDINSGKIKLEEEWKMEWG